MDVVATMPIEWGDMGITTLTASLNYTESKFDTDPSEYLNAELQFDFENFDPNWYTDIEGQYRFAEIESLLAGCPQVTVPAIVSRPADSGFGPPSPNPVGDWARFTQLVDRRILEGAGHNLPAHRPGAVANALLLLLDVSSENPVQ